MNEAGTDVSRRGKALKFETAASELLPERWRQDACGVHSLYSGMS